VPVDDIYVEIMRVRPRLGAEARLLELRDDVVKSYRDRPGFVSCRLLRPEDEGPWVDLWFWRSRAEAEQAGVGNAETLPVREWHELTTVEHYEWAEVLADH
jgi:hypothetical protein